MPAADCIKNKKRSHYDCSITKGKIIPNRDSNLSKRAEIFQSSSFIPICKSVAELITPALC